MRADLHAPTHRRQMDPEEAEASLAEWLGIAVPLVRQALLWAWDTQRETVTAEAVVVALAAGDWDAAEVGLWRESYAAFVTDELAPQWRTSFTRASSFVSGRLGIGVQAEAFGARMATWIDAYGGELVTRLTDGQHAALRETLRQGIAVEGLASATVAQRLRPFVGLTARQARAVAALRATLEAEGALTPAQIDRAVSRRAAQLHRTRAERIARTELADAYNEASLQTARTAQEAGVGAWTKVWLTGADERVCSICGPLHEARAPMEGTFDGGRDRPTAHPGCRCTLIFEEVP